MNLFFFFNDTATTEIYTLSLHDALPIWPAPSGILVTGSLWFPYRRIIRVADTSSASRNSVATSSAVGRSEEHTSELQSRQYLVCRLLLEKKPQHILHIRIGPCPASPSRL